MHVGMFLRQLPHPLHARTSHWTLPLAASAVLLAGSAARCPSAAQDGATVHDREWLAENYSKSEHRIPMRDGVRLHATVYQPNSPGDYPILLKRTPYSCAPYGSDRYPRRLASEWLMEDGYIFVCEDVRGRWMSEGLFDTLRPHRSGELPVDESSDTWDTIEWLLGNVQHHNGKVGLYGVSYPGFYATAALPDAHPAIVAVSPQAPVADFYFDDLHHRGAYTLSYFLTTPLFGIQKDEPTSRPWYAFPEPVTADAYDFFMQLGPLSNADRYLPEENFLWRQLVEHPDYDDFWQARNILPHLRGIDQAILVVGGWFDAEDLYGTLSTYREIERHNPGAFNVLVMGPWSHGQWQSSHPRNSVGDVWFGDSIPQFYQRDVEAPFFRHFLKDTGQPPPFEALVFDTGARRWSRFAAWPPATAERARLFLRADERLAPDGPVQSEPPYTQYLSDPREPVPHTDQLRFMPLPGPYMAEDQRFAERRPDVIEFVTPPLEQAWTLAGPITAHLIVSTTGTDADWVVKLIDVHPDSSRNRAHTPTGAQRSGMRLMVRSEIMRGRYRESLRHPIPFEPGEPTTVEFPLQDVFHTFERGHRLMIQIQSTWFPLFDRNPQTFVPNIFTAGEEDFTAATHRVFHTPGRASWVEVGVLP